MVINNSFHIITAESLKDDDYDSQNITIHQRQRLVIRDT